MPSKFFLDILMTNHYHRVKYFSYIIKVGVHNLKNKLTLKYYALIDKSKLEKK